MLEGVLLLTAGRGRRAEPLSFLRPKSLLPWHGGTVLGLLSERVAGYGFARIAANASRCPDLVRSEVEKASGRNCEIFFEPRPLGTVGTLARLAAGGAGSGAWLVCNTDMVTDMDIGAMIEDHVSSGSHWTVAVGDFPADGSYGALRVGADLAFGLDSGEARHYRGIGLIGAEVMRLALRLRTGSLFGELAALARGAGLNLRSFETEGEWLDTGTPESYRKALLSKGSFVHPGARAGRGASFQGRWFISSGCSVADGTLVKDSVMLDGSCLVSGELVEDVLPWYSERRL
jgi:NDP-sugar pyrophosphorylase family protein